MDRERRGGWVYIMSDRYRGGMYVGVTSHLAARVTQHRNGDGSDFADVTVSIDSFGPIAATTSWPASCVRNV